MKVIIKEKRKTKLRPHKTGRRDLREYSLQMDNYVKHLKNKGLKVIFHED